MVVEAKMGSKSARKCGPCGMKGHTARSNKCAVRIEIGTQVDVSRVPDALLGKPISDEHQAQPRPIPKGELNGFSYEEMDKTNLTVGASTMAKLSSIQRSIFQMTYENGRRGTITTHLSSNNISII